MRSHTHTLSRVIGIAEGEIIITKTMWPLAMTIDESATTLLSNLIILHADALKERG